MDAFTQQTEQFTRMWAEFAGKMMAAGFSFKPGEAPPEAAQQVRDAMLEAMGKYADQYMRSEQFLQMIRQTTESAIGFRKQMNDWLTKAHHQFQAPAREDIDSIIVAIKHMETRLLDRIEELSSRVQVLEQRLGRDDAPHNGESAEAHPSEPGAADAATRRAASRRKAE